MKKSFLSLLIIFMFLFYIMPTKTGLNLLAANLNNGIYNAYVTGVTEIPENCEYTQIASGGILKCDLSNYNEIDLSEYNLLGESLSFYGTEEEFYDTVKQYRVKIIKTEQVNDGLVLCIYGYSYAFGKSIIIDGQKVNIELAIDNSYITVGTPLIYGSY